MPGDDRTICGIKFGSKSGGGKDAGMPHCWIGHENAPSHARNHTSKGGPLCEACWTSGSDS